MEDSVVSRTCKFPGAPIPLIFGTIVSWLAIAVALLFLAFLGVGPLAGHGSPSVLGHGAGGRRRNPDARRNQVSYRLNHRMSTIAHGPARFLFAAADTVGATGWLVDSPYESWVCARRPGSRFVDSRVSRRVNFRIISLPCGTLVRHPGPAHRREQFGGPR
jgi:hypothetical protein